MKTGRQKHGNVAAEIVRRHCPCMKCGKRKWKWVGREQEGIDLQCRSCGRFAQSKGKHRTRHPTVNGLTTIPGGSHAVRERTVLQGYSIDLYVTVWNRSHEFIVCGVAAEEQPATLFKPRTVLTGTRAGYVLSDIILSTLPEGALRILAARIIPDAPKRLAAPSHRCVWQAPPGGLTGPFDALPPEICRPNAVTDRGCPPATRPKRTRHPAQPMDVTDSAAASTDDTGRQRFEMLVRRATDGGHFPTFGELMRGCPLYRNSLQADAGRFAEQVIATLDGDDAATPDLLGALAALRTTPRRDEIVAAARQLEAHARRQNSHLTGDHAGRCHFYAALSGDRASVLRVAAHAVRLAYSRDNLTDDADGLVRAAVAWLLAANSKIPLPRQWTRRSAVAFLAMKGGSFDIAQRMIQRMLASRTAMLADVPDQSTGRSDRSLSNQNPLRGGSVRRARS